jgi:hypothetical protein
MHVLWKASIRKIRMQLLREDGQQPRKSPDAFIAQPKAIWELTWPFFIISQGHHRLKPGPLYGSNLFSSSLVEPAFE